MTGKFSCIHLHPHKLLCSPLPSNDNDEDEKNWNAIWREKASFQRDRGGSLTQCEAKATLWRHKVIVCVSEWGCISLTCLSLSVFCFVKREELGLFHPSNLLRISWALMNNFLTPFTVTLARLHEPLSVKMIKQMQISAFCNLSHSHTLEGGGAWLGWLTFSHTMGSFWWVMCVPRCIIAPSSSSMVVMMSPRFWRATGRQKTGT